MINFLDTCYLLNNLDNLEGSFMISSITLGELESIKTSKNKDFSIKEKANKATKFIKDNYDRIKIMNFKQDYLNLFPGWEINNDLKIVATAIAVSSTAEVIFYTDDISCLNIARHCNLTIGSSEIKEDYKGYKEVKMSNEEMAEFYSDKTQNYYNCFLNEYLIIQDSEGIVQDTLVWDGTEYKDFPYRVFSSEAMGTLKPKKNDPYQECAFDALVRNQVTMIKGPAGSGKSLASLSFLFDQMERGKIDKIIVFCNTVATKGAAKLGYYPGTKDEKILESQIGNLLSSKLSDRYRVEDLINSEQLVLLPLSDVRGFDTTNMRAGIYIPEAQNMDIELMRIALQRIGDDCICIIDGDYNAQVDDESFSGTNNGMRRVSQIFRGQPKYGEVELKNNYRSWIGRMAELL